MQFLSALVLVGAIQGFISGVLLLRSKKGNIQANRLLASLILIFSLACLNLYLMQTGLRYQSGLVSVIAYVVPMLIIMPAGPLLYFYTRSVATSDFKLNRWHRIHFYPVILDLIPYIIGLVFMLGLLSELLEPNDESSWRYIIDQFHTYVDIPRWMSLTYYLFLTGKTVRRTRIHDVVWVRQVLTIFSAFQIIWLMHLVPYVIPAWQSQLLAMVDWYPVYIPLAVIVYWLGIHGFIRTYSKTEKEQRATDALLSPEIIRRTYDALKLAMEKDHLYLDPGLNLERIVKHTGIPQKSISAVLNQHAGKSFNEFVNEYRVVALQKKLIAPSQRHLTIMGLALECGFNSQATMQRSFKLITNQTPKEFQATQLKYS